LTQTTINSPGTTTERERFLSALLESAVDYAIISTDLDGLVTSWNAGAERVLGWTETDIRGQPASVFFTLEDRRAGVPQAEMQRALQTGHGSDERWHLRRDGTEFWASGEMLPLKDETGAVQGFLKILRDRTKERLAAEAQRADAEFLRGVLASSADCIKVLDLEGRLTFMTDNGQKMMHVDDFGAIAGCPWPDLWEGEGRKQVEAALAAARAGAVGHFQGEAPTLKGVVKFWDVLVTAIPSRAGVPEKILAVSRDITAGRDAEQKLQRLAALVEQSKDFIGIAGLDGKILFANHAGLELLGAPSLAALQSRRGIELFAPEETQRVEQIIGPAVLQTGHWSGEVSFRNVGTGAAVPMFYSVYQLRGEAGQVTGYGSIARDLREHRADERRRAALADLTERLRDLTDIGEMSYQAAQIVGVAMGASRAGYATFTPDGETAIIERDWTAPGIASIRGRHRMRDFGSFIDELRAGETVIVHDAGADGRTLAEGLQNLDIRALINLPLREQGKLVAAFFVHSPLPRPWSEAEEKFVSDALERARNAIERRRAEERLQALATSLEQQVAARTAERDRIWHVSRDLLVVADPAGTLLSINPAWSQMLGWDYAQIVGNVADWLIHPDDVARTHEELGKIMTGEAGEAFENRFRTKAGDYRDISWTTRAVDGLMYAVGRDVTEQKAREAALQKAEEQLRQSQKMEALGQLTGGIAHDFNNLLTGIIGSLDIVKRRLADNRPGDVTRFMDAASTSAQRAASLTHRLLAFARRQSLDTKASDIVRLVRGMEDLLHRTLGEDVELQAMFGPEIWPALTDDNQLENAILNLAINARDAMPDGGKLTIEVQNTSLDETYAKLNDDVAAGDYVAISVTDTGSGMPPDVVAKAFDPFFTTKPIGEGTGLGLSMIYGFAKQCAGHVRIYSEVGQGTTVKLFLPRAVAAAEGAEDTAAEVPLGRGETVLVVEDDPTVRLLMVDVLDELGYRHVEAPDGATAVPILRSRQRIDLLVTDVGLPNMNGRQLAEIARSARPGLRVLFVTGYAERAAVRHGFLEPGMEMLTKPFALDALAMKVREMIER
jgi:PAS domain S-box-containing protein